MKWNKHVWNSEWHNSSIYRSKSELIKFLNTVSNNTFAIFSRKYKYKSAKGGAKNAFSLSFEINMGLYLYFCSSYDDLQYLLTIFDLPHLLLHCLCFPHINRPSGNHYFLLFSFVLLILILLCFIYTSSFHQNISHLVKFAQCWLSD